jgi:hypothetical protein
MKNGRPEGEDAESMPVHSDLRLRHQTGDTGGRPSWRSSFLGAPGAKFFMGWLKKTAVAGAVGKVKIPMLYRDFQVTWESPAFGLFHGTAFSTALGSTDSVSEP